jgi:CTP synthase (UTP-ammonia lyase)
MRRRTIALIGERSLAHRAHRGIEASLALYRANVDPNIAYRWIETDKVTVESIPGIFRDVTGIWCVPATPYQSTSGALLAIRHARTERKAFLGTCGGFQHALMEFAGNVLRHEAANEELAPEAKNPLISRLSCPLVGATGRVIVTLPGRFLKILGASHSLEEFNCNFGVNPDLAGIFHGSGLEFVAHDEAGQARAFRLKGHPFFVGTLFQPERRALSGTLHPVVLSFLNAS